MAGAGREFDPREHLRAGYSSEPQDTLSTVLRLLRTVVVRWYVVLLVTVPVAAGAIAYAEQLPAVYESEAIVLVEPRPDGGPATGAGVVRLKAPAYVAYLTAPATTRRLAEELDLAAGFVASALDAQVQSETGNITVIGSSGSAELATDIAAAGADALIAFSREDELLQAQLLAPAVIPEGPAGPPRRLIEAAALLVAIGLGLVAALLVDRRRPRIEHPWEVAEVTGYEQLGRIPRRRHLPDAPGLAFGDPVVGTAIRSLRVRLSGELASHASLVVTSSVAGEGKSTVAALLATAFARTSVEVVLVDADVRRPHLHRLLDGEPGPGLASVLRGQAGVNEMLQPGWTDHLTLLPTAAAPDAGDALTARFPEVLRQLRERFDLIIVDAPPLLGSDEARVLASGSDRVLLVVSPGTEHGAVHESQVALAGLRAKVAGYVLNRSATGPHDGSYAERPDLT